MSLPGSIGAWGKELIRAVELARIAGTEVVRLRSGELSVEMKPGDEPVTVADRRASELIVAGLSASFPEDALISEELPATSEQLAKPRVWLVDPIDGTKDFIRGSDGFAVMIGLCVAQRPIVGVVFQPTSGRLFAAAPARGAWMELPDGAIAALAVSTIADVGAIRLVASRPPLIDATGAQSLWSITALVTGVSILLSEATNNTATATLMLPLTLSLAAAAGVPPGPPALGATLGASFGFMLPISTAPNAMAYGTGQVTVRQMLRTGVMFDVVGFGIIVGGLRVLCPLLGLA